ncbi:NAD(P)-binding protein [Aspergillus violaceofuscus CBS 115571]|uniref:NAD(P)-binding protein n=1 Tax=Aspergillus violaceofuscus (strain CBS 115571) TaxID=1450538 RepID=A0A2V5H968_ASPV1|nr:NAD(P)-binding protein [Aspergillus violaceofuscus CBS 115571]
MLTVAIGSGIGKACALLFAKEGAAGVIVADLDVSAAETVGAQCVPVASNPKFRAEAIQVDITKEDSVKRAVDKAVQAFGRIDYCVNCAGIGVQQGTDIVSLSLADIKRFIEVNTIGTFLVTREVSAVMRSQEPVTNSSSSATNRGETRGAIVNLGSASSKVAAPGVLPYTASKHAVLGLSKNAALDNVDHGIRVNCVCPSWVDTPMVQEAVAGVDGLADFIKAAVPMGRIAHPEEVADAVIFLCSPLTGLSRVVRHITGHDAQGQSVFLATDNGDHHRVLGEQQAIGNIIYSTNQSPVELNDDVDIKYARENEPGIHVHNGTVARLIDFAPGVESPLHRAVSLDYGVVIEGVFKLVLDSGEERLMRPGDTCVNRATAHKWINVTGNGTLPGRMLFILLDVNPVFAGGKQLEGYLGTLAKDYEGR